MLDLEGLANHRGSVLGLVPGRPQPSQRRFETLLWDALRRLDPARPVWIESESRKVGELRVPEQLIDRMRASPCVRVELSVAARVRLLMEDYDFFVEDVPAFCLRLDALRALRGNEVINEWQTAARSGHIKGVVEQLLTTHYDPVYMQSMQRNYSDFANAALLEPANADHAMLAEVARSLMVSAEGG